MKGIDAMTHDHSALLDQLAELVTAKSAGTGLGEVLPEILRAGMQALIEAEVAQKIGADHYERSAQRSTHRNGTRPKTISTPAGDLDLKIPKLRAGSFFPVLLERRRRIDKALYAVIMQAYVHGTSTRSVDDLVRAMGVDSGISKSEVSRICAGLDAEIAQFRDRTLTHTEFPYVFLDATFCKVRVGAHVVSQALVVATGVTAGGGREVLGTAVGESESYEFWKEFLATLRARGLSGVHLVISDAHAGLKAAVAREFTGAAWQRCRVHFMRNLHGAVTGKHAPVVTAGVRTIFAHTDPKEVAAQWDRVADSFDKPYPKAAAMMREAKTDVLAFTAFPKAHWQKIWSNNPIERLNRELKRRTDVVGIFPNKESVIRLVGALLVEINDEMIAAERRYIAAASVADLAPDNTGLALPAAPRT